MKFADQVPVLLELQNLDIVIDKIASRMKALPAMLQDAERAVSQGEQSVAAVREKIKHAEMEKKKVELDVETFLAQTQKLEGQLLTIKTNKEYQALQKEIADRKEHLFQKEDLVLECMETLEKAQEDLLQIEEKLRVGQARLDKERVETQGEMKDLERNLDEKKVYRSGVIKEIPPALLVRYDKVRQSRGGVALARAEEGTCSECHMDIRPQLQNEVKMGDKPVICETCYRIFYDDAFGKQLPDPR